MSLLANVIIIIGILIVVAVTITIACLVSNYKPGGQSACTAGYTLVNGECKSNQFNSCQTTSDCVPNLICVNSVCQAPPAEVPNENIPETIVDNRTIAPIFLPTAVEEKPRELPASTFEIVSDDSDDSGDEPTRKKNAFDIRSAETPVSTAEVSTPYQENNGVYYCNRTEGKGVIDACSYSTATVFLSEDGSIIYEDKDQRIRISNSVSLSRIVNFNNELYGLGRDGTLYYSEDSDPSLKKWTWKKVTWNSLPNFIEYINTPYNGKFLIAQDGMNGYIFNVDGGLVSMYNCRNQVRIYAKDSTRYAVLDKNEKTARIYPTSEFYRDVADLAFDYHGSVIVIPLDKQKDYKRIAMVNWKPYFIC